MRTRVFGLLLLMAGGIMFAQTSTTKSLSISVTAPPSPTGNLLTGKTPTNYTLPSGWNVLCTQTFEANAGTTCETGSNYWGVTTDNMSQTTAKSHSGTHSLAGTYSGEWGNSFRVGVNAPYSEVYVSWYEQKDASGTYWGNGGNFYEMEFQGQINGGSNLVDWCCDANVGEVTSTRLSWIPQGKQAIDNSGDVSAGVHPVQFDGTWHQWEVHYKPNTPGMTYNDGALQIWVDGVNWINLQNTNVSGPDNMAGQKVFISGTAQLNVGLTNATSQSGPESTSCDHIFANGGPYYPSWTSGYGCTNPGSLLWSFAQMNSAFSSLAIYQNGQWMGLAPAAPFNKYIDDVIVLYR